MTVDLDTQLRTWRHQLHQHPEMGFTETTTSQYVAELLTSFGLTPHRGVGRTGVVASLTRGNTPRVIGLRADMDGLPLTERQDLEYASTNGRMHACGHDGHMAMLLGAAAVLAEEGGFDGTVRFFFQPAEEHGRGAQAMIDDGVLDRFPIDAMYGLHNLPGLPAGDLHTRSGSIMASEDTFEITITGRGGHAARPQMVVDPIVIGAEIVLALQTIVSRTVDPSLSAVVSCTEFLTDGVRNAIPSTVTIKGDTRSFDPVVQDQLEARMRQICAGICAAHGATATVTYRHEFVPTVNDPACVAAAAAAATAVVGADRVSADCDPIMASEDFAVFAQQVPACFTFIGNGTEPGAGGTPLHSSDYDFNDEILAIGVAYYVELVRSVLNQQGPPAWVPQKRTPDWACEPPSPAVGDFHRSLTGYAPTPLVDVPALAAELGVGRVLVKDESDRLGLPAFKALGASWAVHRVVSQHPAGRQLTLVAATDGNHGRAVARFARLLGHQASIYVPTAVHPAAVQAIADEEATVTVVDGSYDDTVAVAARAADAPNTVLVQDTAWDGYEQIPSWIVEGYDTLFAEIDTQLEALGLSGPDLVAVPTGVGSLLQAALAHYRSHTAPTGTAVVAVEPETAACIAASLTAGHPVTVETAPTAMAGLNCGTPSFLAWPLISNGLDAAITVTEVADIRAAHDLAGLGISAGPCGAAPLAALRAALTGPGSAERREHLRIGTDSTVVLLSTEGSLSNPIPDLPTAATGSGCSRPQS